MNPIENIWAILKKRVQNTSISTKGDLWSKVKKVWENNSQLLTTVINSIESMPNRIRALIPARGGHKTINLCLNVLPVFSYIWEEF